MKILHILTSPRAEGTPRLVLDWLSINQYDQEVFFLKSDGELKERFIQSNRKIYFNKEFVPKVITIPKIVNAIKNICLETKPDIIISWPTGFSPWINIGARKANVKHLITHAGNPPSNSFTSRYIMSFIGFTISALLKNKVITCSDYLTNCYQSLPLISSKQFKTVYNCFSPSKFDNSLKNKINNIAIMVATFEKHKDHETLIKAWEIIEKDNYDYHLNLVGDGSLKEHYQKMVSDLKLKNISFLGSRNDVNKLLNQSKIFVFSTTPEEGFGTVLLEALASGCKVIASDVPACKEVLENGKWGDLIKYKDEKSLAKKIIKEFKQQIPENKRREQRKYVESFTPENMIKQYIETVL